MLSFQTLDVYRCAIDFLALSDRLLSALPRGQASLSDQLRRAAMSIPLNIAEAQGRAGNPDKARVYAIARGSAMECVAILDVCLALRLIDEAAYGPASEMLERVVAMLTKMCR